MLAHDRRSPAHDVASPHGTYLPIGASVAAGAAVSLVGVGVDAAAIADTLTRWARGAAEPGDTAFGGRTGTVAGTAMPWIVIEGGAQVTAAGARGAEERPLARRVHRGHIHRR